MDIFLGFDFGTSGARAIAIDPAAQMVWEQALHYPTAIAARSPQTWRAALFQLLSDLPQQWRSHLRAIAIDGTSSTVLLCDAAGEPVLPPMMYNDLGDRALLAELAQVVPANHCVLSLSSTLVKALTWRSQFQGFSEAYVLHQADWLAFLLHGQLGISDYHNSLKLGYDPGLEAYPAWFEQLLDLRPLLPRVVPPGTALGTLIPQIAQDFDLPPDCQVIAGTTDSIAAFMASGATQPGTAVTSLGSTLAVKLLSEQRIDQSEYGIYSHRLGALWLVGGASNVGGAVLSQFFTSTELHRLSQQINPQVDSGLDYYPLPQPGERFPIHNPDLPPKLTPRPREDARFLQGLLEGIAQVEAQGYRLLETLGATPLTRVLTAGGGAQNEPWQLIRSRYLAVSVQVAPQTQAAYGTACLAQSGYHHGLA